jgi:prepilin-type N-terminal cleavage/methylation domain-containing protein/prepilin-type processing-associated H-X9-DG protein
VKHRRAFTLLELLVVIAIIAIVISMFIPALGATTSRAHSIRCQTNQRELVAAAMRYRNDHAIHPPAIYYEQVGGSWNTITWDSLIWEYCTATEKAMICPEHQHARGGSGVSGSGYNYNTDFIGAEASMLQSLENARQGIAPSACKHPSHAVMFGDGGEISGGMGGYKTNRFMRTPKKNDGGLSCAGSQSFRHNGATVIGWLDGHVSSTTLKFQSNCEYEQWETNGFLSENDSAYDPRILSILD